LPPVDLLAVATAQAVWADCQLAASSSSLRVPAAEMPGTAILVDSSSGVFRPLVPSTFHLAVFDNIQARHIPVFGQPGALSPAVVARA
jgi:hypothetical protein